MSSAELAQGMVKVKQLTLKILHYTKDNSDVLYTFLYSTFKNLETQLQLRSDKTKMTRSPKILNKIICYP